VESGLIVAGAVLLAAAALCGDAELKPRVMTTQFETPDVVIATAVATEEPFAAKGDGQADCTAAIQKAIDAVHAKGGGVVFLPAGKYRCDGSLAIKDAVTLRGDWRSPEADAHVEGTILMPMGGKGKADGPPFITVAPGGGVRELSIWYPEQTMEAIAPYPWTIVQQPGDNCTVHRVTLVNSYQGIKAGPEWNELHTLRYVYGTPLKCGFFTDFCTDIGRLVHIRFAPRYWLESGLTKPTPEQEAALRKFLREQGTGIEMRRSDWEYFFDVKLEGYARGLHVLAGARGTANAVLYNVEATGGGVGLQVDQVNEIGLALTRCRFDGDETGVLATGSFSTVAQFNSCTLGGKAKRALQLDGNGFISLQNCVFPGWTETAVVAERGTLTVLGCDFQKDAPHIRAAPPVQRALILGNRFSPKPKLEMQSTGDVQVTHHDFAFARPSDAVVVLPPDRKPGSKQLVNVLDHGAKADGKTDNTAAFKAALDEAGKAGGTVYVPAGLYRFTASLNIPAGVELRGIADVPHHTISGGSVLMPTGGKGDAKAAPFIMMGDNAGVRGLTIWYPEQDVRNIVPYPWAIRASGAGCWVMDVSVSNAYQGADFGTTGGDRHLVRYLCGAPLKCGLRVSGGASGVVDSCHFNPHFWGRRPKNFPEPAEQHKGEDQVRPVWEYQQQNLEAFVFGHCKDSLQVNNFVYAALHGLHFTDESGGSKARVINHGTDAGSHALTVDATQPEGIEMVNTELVLLGQTPVASLQTAMKFEGRLSLFNTLSWGVPAATAVIAGRGDVLLQQWNTLQGPITIHGCKAALENLHFQRTLPVDVQTVVTQRVALVGNTAPGHFKFTPEPNVVGRGNALPLGGGDAFASGFEPGQPAPTWKDQSDNARDVEGRCCHVEAGVGRNGGAGLVIAGEDKAAKPSFVYYKVFNVNLRVAPGTVLTYWVKPENELGRQVGVDIEFADGSTLRDSPARDTQGQGVHPGQPKGKIGEWTKIECPVGKWHAEKNVRRILVAYDDAQNTGAFKAVFDDIEVGAPLVGAGVAVKAEPVSGKYGWPLNVSLTATPEAKVRYTVDGSLPDARSPVYGAPFHFWKAGFHEIRFQAFDAEDRPASPVRTEFYDLSR
jgi:hypothetical protein